MVVVSGDGAMDLVGKRLQNSSLHTSVAGNTTNIHNIMYSHTHKQQN